jgi:hypothetical protein
MESSVRFYEALGLVPTPSPNVSADELMLMEMRGGTDLLIVHEASGLIPEFPVSNVGYSGHKGPVDIMIPRHHREDLEQYHAGLQAAGLAPGAISDEPKYGHWYFRIADPNGHTITVLTSHSSFD